MFATVLTFVFDPVLDCVLDFVAYLSYLHRHHTPASLLSERKDSDFAMRLEE